MNMYFKECMCRKCIPVMKGQSSGSVSSKELCSLLGTSSCHTGVELGCLAWEATG